MEVQAPEGTWSMDDLSWREGGLGRANWAAGSPQGHPRPDNSLPWEAAVDSCPTALLQGPVQGAGHGEGPSPTPSAGEARVQGGPPLASCETSDKSLHFCESIFSLGKCGQSIPACKVLLVCFYLK